MSRMSLNDKDHTHMPARVDKALDWLKTSRNSWKEKTKESNAKLKIAKLGIKRARETRDEIQEKLYSKEKQLNQKDIEIAALKRELEQATQEVEALKKKSWLHVQENRRDTHIGTALYV